MLVIVCFLGIWFLDDVGVFRCVMFVIVYVVLEGVCLIIVSFVVLWIVCYCCLIVLACYSLCLCLIFVGLLLFDTDCLGCYFGYFGKFGFVYACVWFWLLLLYCGLLVGCLLWWLMVCCGGVGLNGWGWWIFVIVLLMLCFFVLMLVFMVNVGIVDYLLFNCLVVCVYLLYCCGLFVNLLVLCLV